MEPSAVSTIESDEKHIVCTGLAKIVAVVNNNAELEEADKEVIERLAKERQIGYSVRRADNGRGVLINYKMNVDDMKLGPVDIQRNAMAAAARWIMAM